MVSVPSICKNRCLIETLSCLQFRDWPAPAFGNPRSVIVALDGWPPAWVSPESAELSVIQLPEVNCCFLQRTLVCNEVSSLLEISLSDSHFFLFNNFFFSRTQCSSWKVTCVTKMRGWPDPPPKYYPADVCQVREPLTPIVTWPIKIKMAHHFLSFIHHIIWI